MCATTAAASRARAGRVGETYNIGGWNEMPNRQIVQTVCSLDELRPTRLAHTTD
jgi:dTDP-glucose 4,6-dehydratase